MWNVELKDLQLPPGFFLKEDEDFLYLFYEDVQVATFSAVGVTPTAIKEEVEKYQRIIGSL